MASYRPRSTAGRGPPAVDIHEMLKREAFDGPPAYDSHFERGRPAPAGVVGISDQYIVLDSFGKLQTSDPLRGLFSWNFMVQGVTGDQVIGVRDRVDTVIEMQFGEFIMPAIPLAQYITASSVTGPGGLTLTQNNRNAAFNDNVAPMSYGLSTGEGGLTTEGVHPGGFYTSTYGLSWAVDPLAQTRLGAFTIQFVEAGLQSISDRQGARHHLDYVLQVTNGPYSALGFINNGATKSTTTGLYTPSTANAAISQLPLLASPQGMPGSAWDTYIFTEPLIDVNAITLQFRGPDEPLQFYQDVYYDVEFRTDAGGNVYVQIPYDGAMCIGDRVLVRGFKTGNQLQYSEIAPGNIAIDGYMNNPAGLVVSGNPTLAPNNKPPLGVVTTSSSSGAPSGFVRLYFDPNINPAGLYYNQTILNPAWTAAVAAGTANTSQIPKFLTSTSPTSTPSQVPIGSNALISAGVSLCISKRRIRIPVRLRRVVQRLTNYMGL